MEKTDFFTGWGDQIINVYFEAAKIQVKPTLKKKEASKWEFIEKNRPSEVFHIL
jgi:hypothetical protein